MTKFSTTEVYTGSDGKDIVFVNEPEYNQTLATEILELAAGASKVLTDFRKKWEADHKGHSWALGLEIDNVPLYTEGMIFGYLVLSEADGKSYDYAPAKQIREEEVEES